VRRARASQRGQLDFERAIIKHVEHGLVRCGVFEFMRLLFHDQPANGAAVVHFDAIASAAARSALVLRTSAAAISSSS
jgi:hypothetical protein